MRVVFSCLRNCLGCMDDDFRDEGRERITTHRPRNCKSARTKCNSSCTWIALGCSRHVTTSCDGWERHTRVKTCRYDGAGDVGNMVHMITVTANVMCKPKGQNVTQSSSLLREKLKGGLYIVSTIWGLTCSCFLHYGWSSRPERSQV